MIAIKPNRLSADNDGQNENLAIPEESRGMVSHEINTAIERQLDVRFLDEQFTKVAPNSIQERVSRCKVDITATLAPPPVCLEVVEAGDSSTLGTLGNFSAVIGKAKSRKTFFASILMAGCVRNAVAVGKIRSRLPEAQNKVLYLDTEQGKFHVQRVVKRVCQLSGVSNPTNFDAYALRPYSTGERIEMIEYLLRTTPNLGFVVIDGIRDLVADINSPEEATNSASRLLKWTEELNIHVCVVLHQNKGDNNARGHLGTEIVNKAETVISVTKQEKQTELSVVEAEFCRDRDFLPFAFRIDEKGLPEVLPEFSKAKQPGKSKLTPFEMDDQTHKKIVRDMFSSSSELCYGDLLIQVGLALSKMATSVGENKRKDFVSHYINKGWIVLKGREGKKSLYQHGLG